MELVLDIWGFYCKTTENITPDYDITTTRITHNNEQETAQELLHMFFLLLLLSDIFC